MKGRTKELTDLLPHLLVSYVLFAILFAVAFYQDPLVAFRMAMNFVLFLQVPGILIAKYVFGDRFGHAETVIIGAGLGLVIVPFLVYLVNIFEVTHTRILCYLVPAGLTIVFAALLASRRPGGC